MARSPRRPCSLAAFLAALCPLCLLLFTVVWLVLQDDDDDQGGLARNFRHNVNPNCGARRAYACVATSYYTALGCFTVAKSLILAKSSCPVFVLATPDVSKRTLSWIESELGAQVRTRELSWPQGRRAFDPMMSYLSVWDAMADYEKVILISHETLVLRRLDELFEREELSATQDLYSDMLSLSAFTPSVMVISPSRETHTRLLSKLTDHRTIAFSVRTVLGAAFPDWKRLPMSFVTPSWLLAAPGLDLNTVWRFVKAVQFSNELRPWESSIGQRESADKTLAALYRLWWRIYDHPIFEPLDLSSTAVFAEPVTWWQRFSNLALFLVLSTAALWAIVLWSGCHNGNYTLQPRGTSNARPSRKSEV